MKNYKLFIILGWIFTSLVATSVVLPIHYNELRNQESPPNPEQPIGEIVLGTSVVQSLGNLENNLKGIKVLFATYQRSNTCNIEVEVWKEPLFINLIHKETVPCSNLKDNSYAEFLFDNQPESSAQKYYLVLRSDGTNGNAVTVWSSLKVSRDELYINNEKKPIKLVVLPIY